MVSYNISPFPRKPLLIQCGRNKNKSNKKPNEKGCFSLEYSPAQHLNVDFSMHQETELILTKLTKKSSKLKMLDINTNLI